MWAKELSEGAYVGASTHKGAPGGCWRALVYCGHQVHPLMCYLHQKFINIRKKIVLNFQGILRILILGSFLLHGENRKQDKHGILFYWTK